MDAPTDADLIRTSIREPRAFAGIFDRHFGRVRGYLGRRVEPEIAANLFLTRRVCISTFACAAEIHTMRDRNQFVVGDVHDCV
jgi:hypothetical protein